MSIPLDRLYHYIETIAEQIHKSPVIIYRFYPYGSKKLEDLIPTKHYSWQELVMFLQIICHDQEPLVFDLYKDQQINHDDGFFNVVKSSEGGNKSLRLQTITIYDQTILVHSEQRSLNLNIYQQHQYIDVYYWSHALLALDWFRYANHITIKKCQTKTFLIYNRAWTGTREYRLKFADLLIDYHLVNECQTSLQLIDQDIYYKDHNFVNKNWQPRHQLENYFDFNNASSASSADFIISDYANTDIEIVLETLFDDDRLHLTEKSLRPIACGQPFILAATHGSLEYLRNYGFKTFGDVIDESYDLIHDPMQRLQSIVTLMNHIALWTNKEKNDKFAQLKKIAEYNQQHFFSDDFFNHVVDELQQNLSQALTKFQSIKSCNNWNTWAQQSASTNLLQNFLENNTNWGPTKAQFDLVCSRTKNISNNNLTQV